MTEASKESVVSKKIESIKLAATVPAFVPRSVVTPLQSGSSDNAQATFHLTYVPRYRSPGTIVIDRLGKTKKKTSKNG